MLASILQVNLRCMRCEVLRPQVIYWDHIFFGNQSRNSWLMKDLVEELMEPCWRPCLVEEPEALPGGGPGGPAWWRPCLVEDLEALPGGGCPLWGSMSPTLRWSSHSLPLLLENCYHKLPLFVTIPDYNYISLTTCWSKTCAVCSRPWLSEESWWSWPWGRQGLYNKDSW